MPERDLRKFIAGVGQVVASCVDSMPMQQAFIDRYCTAGAA